MENAARATAQLIGCYPSGKPSDPETYIAAIAAVLAEYPQEIVEQVTSPSTGLARHLKFLPSVAEVSDACETAMQPYRLRWRDEFRRREREIERQNDLMNAPDAETEKRIARGLAKLSMDLAKVGDPSHGGSGTLAVSSHTRRVIDDLARRKSEASSNGETT